MQYGFNNDVLAFAQFRANEGVLGSNSIYRSYLTSQTSFENRQSRREDVLECVSRTPASTVSDQFYSSDSSPHSQASTHTDYSSPAEDVSVRDDVDEPVSKNDNVYSPESASSTSKSKTEQKKSIESQSHGKLWLESQATSLSNNSRKTKHGKVTNTDEVESNDISRLPYRPRHLDVNESVETYALNNDSKQVAFQSTAPKPTSNQSFTRRSPAGTQPSRCYSSILNPFVSFASARGTPTESPQHAQTNARRRPMCSAVPPPRLRRDTDNTDAIVRMIVIFCTNLIQSIWPVDNTTGNSSSSSTTQQGGNVLPLQVFITETLRRSKTSYSTLQIALFYLILLKQCLPELATPGQNGQSGCRAMMCGRRMFLTALILASKYLQDRNYSARAWSKISGLPMKEINDNERRYLRFVGWDLHVPKDAFENWSKIVLAICRMSTGQDSNGQNSHQPPPPSPGMGCISQISRKGQLQDMCPEDFVQTVRSWWCFNLQSLRTDVVRCPRKTEQFVLSIPQLRGSPALSRPLLGKKCSEPSQDDSFEQDILPDFNRLSRPPSMNLADNVSQHIARNYTWDDSKAMPPPPPTLGVLPTPQTTPRCDLTNIWKNSPRTTDSRCKDSASLLRGLDRPCPWMSMSKFPVPRSCHNSLPGLVDARPQDNMTFLSQPSPGWLEHLRRHKDTLQTPDTSSVSSPESIISDVFSVSGFVGRSRTSSFSSTSSRSILSYSGSTVSDPERCEGFKKQLSSLDAQIAPRIRDWTNTDKDTGLPSNLSQPPSRPQTAFRVNTSQPADTQCLAKVDVSDSESVSDEGYCSGDYLQEYSSHKKRQTAALSLVNARIGQDLDMTPTASATRGNLRPTLPRPNITRSTTQVYAPTRPSNLSTHQTLKRSRSESFDLGTDLSVSESNIWESSQPELRNIQRSNQPWAACKQPLPCGLHNTNKRIAMQSAATARASAELKQEAYNAWYKAACEKLPIAKAHEKQGSVKPTWQPFPQPLAEIHL